MSETDISSLFPEEIAALPVMEGQGAFRSKQIFEWLHAHRVGNFEEMTNLPAALRGKLAESAYISLPEKVRVQESATDGTRKYLLKMHDGELVESVFMKYKHGNTVCISSQVGCRMGCKFCASTVDGLSRSLTASEMAGQIYTILKDTGERVSGIVVMGMGEPMDNYDNLIRFIRLISDERGYGLSRRSITVSTCGLVPEIKRFAEEGLPVTLAISLHAPNDEKRRLIMPIANRYSIAELMDACRFYFDKTGRRVTFEYSLISGQNDTDADAEELSVLAGSAGAHINLIPVNPVRENGMSAPDKDRVIGFQKKLEKNRINATIRRELGRDIDGACGQLRRRTLTGDFVC